MRYPQLQIGALDFEEGFSLINVSCQDGRDLLEYLSLQRGKDLILTDFSHLHGVNSSLLLKFVELYPGRLIVHSSKDLFTDVMLSRFREFKKVYKRQSPESDSFEEAVSHRASLFKYVRSYQPHFRKVSHVW